MMLKRLLSLLFWMLMGALKPVLAQLPDGYNDLKIIYNIDSLENSIQQLDKNSNAYYWAILTLEKSRETFRSCYIGKYISEIDRISKSKKNEWGMGYSEYLKVLRNLIILKGDPYDNIQLAEKALSIFEKNQDNEAVFLTHMLIINCIKLQLTKNGLLFEKDDYWGIAHKIQYETIKLIEPHLNHCKKFISKCQDDIFKIKFYIFSVTLWNTLWVNKSNNDSSFALCKKILETIGNNKKIEFYKADALNLIGNIYFNENKLDSTIKYHLNALKYIINKESNLNVLLFCNIGSEYFLNGQYEEGFPYFKTCIENNYKLGNIFPTSSALAYRNLGNNYYAKFKLDYKNAFSSLDSFINITEPINNQTRIDEFKNYKTQENLNKKIQNEKILELKNKQSRQGLIAVSILILLLAIILLGVLISRKKLGKAYQQIQELQHSREKFYSIVAHDLKSPLSSYQGLANTISYLLKKKEYEQIERISQKIDDNGAKIQLMLQNLFQWSLSEQQNLLYKPKPTDLIALFEGILPLYEELAKSKGVELIKDIEIKKTANVDPNYLSTIVRNLLDNAIKNSNSKIIFYSQIIGTELIISVSNNGEIGSPKITSIQKLFSSTSSWTPGQEGIGLGLVLVKDFTKKMGGEIKLNKIKNEICFNLKIPV